MDIQSEIDGVRTWYNLIADGFEERYEGVEGLYWDNFESKIVNELIDVTDKVVLDLGCGGGRYALSVQEKVKEIVGIDISDKMINIARKKLKPGMSVEFLVGDATNTCFEDEYFDVVVSLGMFEYLEDPSPFLVETNRILKPKGIFSFTCHNKSYGLVGLLKNMKLFQVVLKPVFKGILNSLRKPTTYTDENYYGFSTQTRARLWNKVRHDLRAIDILLRSNGLRLIDYRSFTFKIADKIFKVGTRIRNGKLRSSLFRTSIFLNRFLGGFPLTRRLGGNLIIKAQKID